MGRVKVVGLAVGKTTGWRSDSEAHIKLEAGKKRNAQRGGRHAAHVWRSESQVEKVFREGGSNQRCQVLRQKTVNSTDLS